MSDVVVRNCRICDQPGCAARHEFPYHTPRWCKQIASMIVPNGFCVEHGPGCDGLHEQRPAERGEASRLPTPTMEELVESGEFRYECRDTGV